MSFAVLQNTLVNSKNYFYYFVNILHNVSYCYILIKYFLKKLKRFLGIFLSTTSVFALYNYENNF